jgi:all-trans-retinol 13,14-reductase
VIVLDKNPMPGGTANVFTKEGFTFPMGPTGFANGGFVRQALARIGLETLELDPVDYRLLAFGKDILLSRPFDVVRSELEAAYPRDAEGIDSFYQIIAERIPSYHEWVANGASGDLSWTQGNTEELLARLVGDPGLRRILGSIGATVIYSDFDLLAAMWMIMSEDGIYYPRGGLREFCTRLAEPLRTSDSGRLHQGRRVMRIEVHNGRASGIILEDGTAISCRSVISNADFKNTFLNLLPKDALPPGLYHEIASAPQTMSKIQVCLGLRASRVDLSAFTQASRIIYRRNGSFDFQEAGIDWKVHEIDPARLAREELEIQLLSQDDRSLAPQQGATLIIRTPADYGHFQKYKTGGHGRAPGYVEYKTRLAKALVAEAGRLLPGLSESIEVMDVATPLTFEEFGSRSEGAVAGWSWNKTPGPSRTTQLVLTPIAGLYMAGYQAFTRLALGGLPSAIASGLEAARSVLEGAGPASDFPIPIAGE